MLIAFHCRRFGRETEMDLGREFRAVQSNGFSVVFKVRRDEEGRQRFTDADAIASDGTSTDGSIRDSQIEGDRFVVTVEWEFGGVGRYVGQRDLDGRLSGTTFDLNTPESQATWFVPEMTFSP
jgi:hypothetical protein